MKDDDYKMHAAAHSTNAFCGFAGSEEMQHLHDLIGQLSDKELKLLVKKVGITFDTPKQPEDREEYEMVIDEADREDFYREYRKIMRARKNV